MKHLYLIVFTITFSLCAISQSKNTNTKKSTLSNSGTGQQNNNTGTGTQKVYNNKNTTNKDNRQINVNGNAFFDSSKQVNNYNGIVEQRVLTPSGLDDIISHISSKKKKIEIYISPDYESNVYGTSIVDALKSKGYNITWVGVAFPNQFDKIYYKDNGNMGDSTLEMHILPRRNTRSQ